MQVEKLFMDSFITAQQVVYVIPVYQRNYSWRKEQCKQLFDDLLKIVNTGEKHFFGTIAQKGYGLKRHTIIDGQQRLTTVMLLIKAICDLTDDENLKQMLKNQYLLNPYCKEDDMRIKLKPVRKDEPIYNKLVSQEEFAESEFTTEEKNSKIYRNYCFFKECLLEAVEGGYSLYDIKESLRNLEMVCETLDSENPQVIFESMNSTGLDLSQTDLIRNYLLMQLEYKEQETLHDMYWAEMERLIGSDNIERFFTHYFVFKRSSAYFTSTADTTDDSKHNYISAKNLYAGFKEFYPEDRVKDKDSVETVFKDIIKYAKYYSEFLCSDVYDMTDQVKRRTYNVFQNLGLEYISASMFKIRELYDEEKISTKDYLGVLRILEIYGLRVSICATNSSRNTNISSRILRRLKDVDNYENFSLTFWNIIASLSGVYAVPADDEFKEALYSIDIYNVLKSRKCKYLLYELEYTLNRKECPSFELGTIEHIMPRTLSSKWKSYLQENNDEDYENYIHRLGNLTLTGYNSELSNNVFDEKKKEYARSSYTNTRRLASTYKWTSKQIRQRTAEMVSMILRVWPVPEEYNKKKAETVGKTHTLNDDLMRFKGTKPEIMSVKDASKEVKSWKEFCAEVVRELYKENDELFLDFLSEEAFPGKKRFIGTQYDDTGNCSEITNNLYFYYPTNTEEMLRVVKSMAQYYDSKLNTSFVNDIWFILKM